MDRHEGTTNPLPDITNTEMFLFLAFTVQMGHGISDRHANYWIREEKFFTHLYLNTETVSYTSNVTCKSQTMTKKSKRMTTITTDYGK